MFDVSVFKNMFIATFLFFASLLLGVDFNKPSNTQTTEARFVILDVTSDLKSDQDEEVLSGTTGHSDAKTGGQKYISRIEDGEIE